MMHTLHPPDEDDDNADLSDMEEGDADASAVKLLSKKQQVYKSTQEVYKLCRAASGLIALTQVHIYR